VLILLPPSEGKADPVSGPPLDLAALSFPALTTPRRSVAAAVVRLATGSRTKARAVLGLSAHQDAEIERDARLLESPTAPAGRVYTGVLYDALGYPTLPTRARARADRWVVVSSGLFGAVRLPDPIPAYRLSGDVSLPRIGRLASFWRPHLSAELPEHSRRGVVLDLRSGAYAAAWKPDEALAERTVVARVMQRRADGSVQVVSHHNKATKGRLVRALVSQGTDPRSVGGMADLVASLGYAVDLVPQGRGRPARLDVVVDDL
jgi:cytoplasmic iron level regulating protein YaaA (DUF328/UPF0246 family)